MTAIDSSLKSLLLSIAHQYDSNAPLDSPGQALLRAGEHLLRRLTPAGLLITSGGGKGRTTITPWLGILDPDETSRPQSGLYVVYIYDVTLQYVYLALIQGTDQGQHLSSLSPAQLHSDGRNIRNFMPSSELDGFTDDLRLGSRNPRQGRYEAGAVLAKKYELSTLSSDALLTNDLKVMVRLYRNAVVTKRFLLLSHPGLLKGGASVPFVREEDAFRDFCPKNDFDYNQRIAGRILIKTRRHETLIRQFGEFAVRQGLRPSTNVHPRDLTLIRGSNEWLIEAKIVGGNPALAVREAIGQLLEYEFFFYQGQHRPIKVALFSENVGAAFLDLLSSLKIGAIWKSEAGWGVSGPARDIFND